MTTTMIMMMMMMMMMTTTKTTTMQLQNEKLHLQPSICLVTLSRAEPIDFIAFQECGFLASYDQHTWTLRSCLAG